MYQIITVKDEVSVPPVKFDKDLTTSVMESIGEKMEGKIDNELGVILAVMDVENIGEGRILPGNPSVHYPVDFKLLCWMPKNQEVVEGEIVDIAEFGAFVRVGGFDGLVHISQVMDDFVSYDEKNGQLVGKQSKRMLKEGDKVRARIISISFKETNKIGLTMRQHLLGAIKWATADAKEAAEAEKVEKKEEKKVEKKGKK
ncbi:MAG: DNA-directed RNA polymerase [Nanoarchaeota archaeon]|nr:DNA-directed RNA polymerase [Nanoarchaeota archaeon]MBU4124197.1 DNA-directed RNA polymerase [Nanoarchaeota archaeon]